MVHDQELLDLMRILFVWDGKGYVKSVSFPDNWNLVNQLFESRDAPHLSDPKVILPCHVINYAYTGDFSNFMGMRQWDEEIGYHATS